MIWATNKYWFGSNKSKQRNIKAESPLRGWWPLHCKVSFSDQRKVFKGGTWVPGTRGQKGCSGSSCLLTGQEERADLSQEARGQYLQPPHCRGLDLLAETLPHRGCGSEGGPHLSMALLDSLSLSSCFIASCDFQIGPRIFLFVLLESLPISFYSLVSSFLWSSVLFLLFAFMSFF